ncbi:hypothetical protein PFISCL1PPCAC_17782, partial [Pristionchus fissidentatus]
EEEEGEETEEEEEEEDGEVEQIEEEEALSDSAARHYVSAHKVVERFDELADSSDLPPIEQIIASAVATPERMRLFIVLWLVISAVFVVGLERAFAANMNLMTPHGEELHTGLQSRQQLSRIGVAEVREFLHRRSVMRSSGTRPSHRLYAPSTAVYKHERIYRLEEEQEHVAVGAMLIDTHFENASIAKCLPEPTSFQCTYADRPSAKNTMVAAHPVQPPLHVYSLNMTTDRMSIKQNTVEKYLGHSKTLVSKQLQQLRSAPCKPTTSLPCKPAVTKPTKSIRPLRPTKTQPLAPTVSRQAKVAMKPTPRQYSPSVYNNYSVMRVYQDRSLRRDPKPCYLPSKSIYNGSKIAEKKKEESKTTNTAVNRIKKRREQQNVALRKMSKRSIAPPVIYANASALPSNSRALMRKSSFAAGHCDRRAVKELRPLPCISYKEQLPRLAPVPRRSIAGAAPAKKTAKTTSANSSKKSRSPKKEYIRRIPLV